jgi:hypothetical protein
MGIGGVLLMPLRGVLLWVVIPLALMTWPFAAITSKLRRGRWVSARRCVRFGDDLLTATLGNTIVRPFLGPCPWPWQPGGEGLGGPVLLGLW